MVVNFTTFVRENSRVLGECYYAVGMTTILGMKRFLAYDQTSGWQIRDLNLFERIKRNHFYSYPETNLSHVYNQIKKEYAEYKDQGALEGFPVDLMRKIEMIWMRHSDTQACAFSFMCPKTREITIDYEGKPESSNGHERKILMVKKIRELKGLTNGKIFLQKYGFSSWDIKNLMQLPFFKNKKKTEINLAEGYFKYPESTVDELHWIANFASDPLFSFNDNSFLSQSEVQVMEHPALMELSEELQYQCSLRHLSSGEAVLVRGAKREVSLDLESKFGKPKKTLLSPDSMNVKQEKDLYSKIRENSTINETKIFAIKAPVISARYQDKNYTLEDLKTLFFSSLAAFSGIKIEDPVGIEDSAKIIIHTGNWGCRTSGNSPKVVALMQLAAARFAGIDKMVYYPLDKMNEFNEAMQIFNKIERENPEMTLLGFFEYLKSHLTEHNLEYPVNRN